MWTAVAGFLSYRESYGEEDARLGAPGYPAEERGTRWNGAGIGVLVRSAVRRIRR
jgi:hypothetical protein